MKIAILGKGKTGQHLVELAKQCEQCTPTIFDSSNRPTQESLQGHDVIISFLTGEIFTEYIPMLVATGIPVVTGSTGVLWPEETDNLLKTKQLRWIYGYNFSLGMNLVYEMIQTLAKSKNLFENYNFSLHEIHHTQKLDAPSGTALKWAEWLQDKTDITSERTGDVVGIHKLCLETEFESITLKHQAKDRKVFAQGALWAAKQIISNEQLPYGLNKFEKVALQALF